MAMLGRISQPPDQIQASQPSKPCGFSVRELMGKDRLSGLLGFIDGLVVI